MFLEGKLPHEISSARIEKENLARKCFAKANLQVRLYIYWYPQILEDSGDIKKEAEDVLIPGFRNPKNNQRTNMVLNE